MRTGKGTYTFTTDTLPDKAGIDPLLLLVDQVAGRQSREGDGSVRSSCKKLV